VHKHIVDRSFLYNFLFPIKTVRIESLIAELEYSLVVLFVCVSAFLYVVAVLYSKNLLLLTLNGNITIAILKKYAKRKTFTF